MEIIEDKGQKETISKEIGINIDLNDGNNNIYIIPIFYKTNLFLDNYISYTEFYYQNYPKKSNKKSDKKLLYILIPIISIIIIAIAILLILRHRKKNNKEITVDKVLSEELTNIEK